MLSKVSGNNINLRSGEVVTFRDLINCVIVGGANDCAYVIAYSLFDDIQDFVDLMNEKASELGMNDTHYENITGLHDSNMVTTLSDVVILSKYALTQYTYIDMTHQYKYIMAATNRSGSRVIYTRNHFMTSAYTNLYYRPDVSGINAGSTSEAGHCAVITAENSGTSYLAIAMGSSSDGSSIYAFTTIRSMLDWAYENFRYVVIAKDTDVICELPVKMSSTVDHISVMPKNTVEVFMEGDVDIDNDIKKTVVMLSDDLTAPVESDETVGYLTLSYKDEILARVELVTKTVIPRSEFLYLLSMIYDFIKSRTVLFVLIVAAVFGIIYVIVKAMIIENKRRIAARRKIFDSRKNANQIRYVSENHKNKIE